MRPISFTLSSPPRTKKNSGRIIHIKGKSGGQGFTKLLPSEAYEEWLDCVLLQGAQIRYALQRSGHKLPITSPVSVRALVFRQADTGDTNGFYQAIADALHSPEYRFSCKCGARAQTEYAANPALCRTCGQLIRIGKQSRKGLGILQDDSQIQSWDGSRLYVDRANPRVQIEISAFTEVLQQDVLEFAGAERW